MVRDLSTRRNEIAHHIIATSEQWTVAFHRPPDRSRRTLPNPIEVEKLANEVTAAANALNHARLPGRLALALDADPAALNAHTRSRPASRRGSGRLPPSVTRPRCHLQPRATSA